MTADLCEQFDLRGFRPGAPTVDAARIDRAVCEESQCSDCGAAGLSYRPYYQARTRTYRAFATCRVCGIVEEF